MVDSQLLAVDAGAEHSQSSSMQYTEGASLYFPMLAALAHLQPAHLVLLQSGALREDCVGTSRRDGPSCPLWWSPSELIAAPWRCAGSQSSEVACLPRRTVAGGGALAALPFPSAPPATAAAEEQLYNNWAAVTSGGAVTLDLLSPTPQPGVLVSPQASSLG